MSEPLISVHWVWCSLSDPNGFFDMAHIRITLFIKDFYIMPIDDTVKLDHLAMPTSDDCQSRNLDQWSSFWWSMFLKIIQNCQYNVRFFWLWRKNFELWLSTNLMKFFNSICGVIKQNQSEVGQIQFSFF